ncbi:MerR family transcriptional regulator [Streptomyces zhihengii]|uniref:MerR family transcriptional regulator n=1 Tax=Streptomyces zhihengii TaxID=1818004 RepID=UPI0034515BF5
MRIGELARRTGVSERSLRYYEKEGLLSADRTPGGHREYGGTAVDRVGRIQQLYAAGLCSSKIATLLPCMRDTDGGPATPDDNLVRDLTVERERIDRMIDDLVRSRALLDDVIRAAAHDTATATAHDTTAPGRPVPAGSGAA